MVSSDVLRSSPLEGARRPLHTNSSSPDLPPLRDVLTAKNETQPPIHGNRAIPISIDESSGFISASHLQPTTEPMPKVASIPSAALLSTVPCHNAAAGLAEDTNSNGGFIAGDPAPLKEREDDIVVVKITGKSTRKLRQPKVSKPEAPKRARPKPAAKSKTLTKGAAEKGPSPAMDNDGKDTEDKEIKAKTSKPRAKKTGTMSSHFPSAEEPGVSEKQKKVDVNEPLHLEQAAARRLDWTPPAQKAIVNVDSDSSAFKQLGSSEADHPRPIFKDLVEGYSCLEVPAESVPQTMLSASDEDSSFLKKRKRIELLATTGANTAVAAPEKSPTKKPPKKKKPRTITELATAAYRVASQPETETPDASILDHFQTTNNEAGSAGDAPPKITKGKGNQRRKTSKAPKKKAPPKPILLSPSTALAQVANQDFVFGTSSQLAREESPTVLRDLQAALRQSNQNDDMDFAIPINSDAIEPPEQRSNLWDAAARDAEGDLFDVEVINLTEDTSRLDQEDDSANPFGYRFGGDDSVIAIEAPVSDNRDPFAKPSDALRSPSERAAPASGDGAPYFSDSDLSTSTNIQRSVPEQKEIGQENVSISAAEPDKLPQLRRFHRYSTCKGNKKVWVQAYQAKKCHDCLARPMLAE
jgi:hypothetical protein